MKVRCIKEFASKGKVYKIDDELKVSKEECSLLVNQKLCVIIPDEIKKEDKKKPTKKVEKK